MANKQYIGARYVPLIDGEWDENKVYEPLTVVMYLTNSYTSKTFVPAGTLPTDTDYWALTGNYNAGIGMLSDRLDIVEGDVSDLKGAVNTLETETIPAIQTEIDTAVGKREKNLAGRKFIIIGDSYGGLGWTTNVVSRLNLDAHVINIGGAGFYAAGGGQTFKDGLEAYAETLTADERAEFTDIIVGGGVNDYNETVSNITSAINTFITFAHTNFPNARLGVACVSWMKRGNDIDGYVNRVIPTYRNRFTAYGYTYYIPNAYLPMHNYANIDSDGIHPNADGTAAITDFMSQYLLTGDADYIVCNSPTVTSVGVTGSFGFNTKMSKDGIDILFSGGTITFATPKTFNSWSGLSQIGSLAGGCISGHVSTGMAVTGTADLTMTVPCTYITSTEKTYEGVATLSIYDGRVDISGVCMDYLTAANTYGAATMVVLGAATAHVSLLSA